MRGDCSGSGVGCALGSARLWFTSGFGIVDEIYCPRIDIPQVRDLGFIVADDRGFWVEAKRLNSNVVRVPGAGIPALEITHAHTRFVLRLRVTPDPDRDVLLVNVALEGEEHRRGQSPGCGPARRNRRARANELVDDSTAVRTRQCVAASSTPASRLPGSTVATRGERS